MYFDVCIGVLELVIVVRDCNSHPDVPGPIRYNDDAPLVVV